ncbi:MAG: putative capsid protein [Cressdnaviricota sp.]|nr:MAG: putative capsid protein [Cressdnaviricota sp.]
MFYRKRRYQRKPVKGKKRVARKGAKRVAVSKAVKTYVKAQIHRQVENKVITDYQINQTIVTANSVTAPYYVPLTPMIAQGVASNGRIGNVVTVVKGWIKGYVNLLPYNVTTNPTLPLRVKLWLCSERSSNAAATLNQLPGVSDFFQNVNGLNGNFQGNMLDILRSPNTDNWIIHATKTMELGLTAQYGTFGGYADNSKFQLPYFFNFKKHLGKCKFDDGSNYITNRNLFLIIQCVAADGSLAAYQSAENHYTIRWEYEDA